LIAGLANIRFRLQQIGGSLGSYFRLIAVLDCWWVIVVLPIIVVCWI
jgi:hypothetical protein